MRRFLFLALLFGQCTLALSQDIWTLQPQGSIRWEASSGQPLQDHIEMSGRQLSVVLRYGVASDGHFSLDRNLVFPLLRLKPNLTHDSLMQSFVTDIPSLVTIDGMPIVSEKTESVEFDGTLSVRSTLGIRRYWWTEPRVLALRRELFPSPDSAYYIENYVFTNIRDKAVTLRVPQWSEDYVTPEEAGVYGSYKVSATLSRSGSFIVEPGDSLSFSAIFSGRKVPSAGAEPLCAGFAQDYDIQANAALSQRRDLLSQWHSSLILETPDPELNAMFSFAKIRGSESIYQTKGGLMHGPGGEAYYAAVWTNDQAEYINPFFPFLGYETGNASALNAYRHFARYMNEEFRPIPTSIISEGVSFWNGAGDRGDAAMIAYGASRYALAKGEIEEARELWPLIEWCLEYCHRKLTDDGVVASDSDELEGRFPSGDANLCTSSLYYDALISASYLGQAMRLPSTKTKAYTREAVALRKAIDRHFGEGDTYRYFTGCEKLRSWICIPLTMGIYERAEGTVNALFSPKLCTPEGFLTEEGDVTFWDRSTLYALRGILAAGEVDRGVDFLKQYSHRRLLGGHVPYAVEASPEGGRRHLSAESGLYCRIFIEGLFGLRPTGLRSFDLTPRLPGDWDNAALRHIRAFGSDFDIVIAREGEKLRVEVSAASAEPVFCALIRPGDTIKVKIP